MREVVFLFSVDRRQEDQGGEPGGGVGRRRDDQDHLGEDQGETNLPLLGAGLQVL